MTYVLIRYTPTLNLVPYAMLWLCYYERHHNRFTSATGMKNCIELMTLLRKINETGVP
jgi:hypothetical protein